MRLRRSGKVGVDGNRKKRQRISLSLDVLSLGKRPINILIVTPLTALVIKSNLRASNSADSFFAAASHSRAPLV